MHASREACILRRLTRACLLQAADACPPSRRRRGADQRLPVCRTTRPRSRRHVDETLVGTRDVRLCIL